MQLLNEQLQRRAYDYSDAQQVTEDGYTWYCFSDDWVWETVPRHITLGYIFLEEDIPISSLSDNFLSFILLADDPYK